MSIATKERPILFSGPMIRAILEGAKTQTRRVMKPQPRVLCEEFPELIHCPYGQPGDRLWVRETWGGDELCGYAYRADHPDWLRFRGDGEQPDSPWKPSIHMPRSASRISLEITGVRVDRVQEISEADAKEEGIKIPVSREGCPEGFGVAMFQIPTSYPTLKPGHEFRAAFSCLWDEINAKRGYGWKKNPWVWVVEFTRSKS